MIVQERLASLGSLTAGIAHEIKNPLNFVNNFAQVSVELGEEIETELSRNKSRLDPQDLGFLLEVIDDLKINLTKIAEHGRRADGIIRSMLEHSRGGEGQVQDVDLNALLADYVNLAYHGMKSQGLSIDIDFEMDLAASLPSIRGVAQELGRVFLNLINNACHALVEKSKELDGEFSPRIAVSTRAGADQVEVRIRDNGGGIPEAIRDKVFDPFFTTKFAGEGTGLGLSLSYDIVVQGNGGTLDFESEAGEYTEFVVALPRDRARD